MKEIKLTLTKTEAGITAANESTGTIDIFDESENNRHSFVKYILDEFLNKEVDNGKKYL